MQTRFFLFYDHLIIITAATTVLPLQQLSAVIRMYRAHIYT